MVVQHGTSRVPVGAQARDLVSQAELRDLMSDSDVVVLQGGPGGIIDSLVCGRRPIVVPRRSDLGEHVDDHQVAFARHMAQLGEVVLAEHSSELVAQLEAALIDPERLRVPPYVPQSAVTAARVSALVDDLLNR